MIKLDHPCRDTCSGWKQGFERGRAEGIREAAERLKREAEALEPHSNTAATVTRSAENWVRALISGEDVYDKR